MDTDTNKEEQCLFAAAIDFGTTYSGWAFSAKMDPFKVFLKHWVDPTSSMMFNKTSTCILFDCEKVFSKFGFEAEAKYMDLILDTKQENWYLFRRFKMSLFNMQGQKYATTWLLYRSETISFHPEAIKMSVENGNENCPETIASENQKQCANCLRGNVNIIATLFCRTCKDPEPLCDNCAKLHSRNETTKDHEICKDFRQFHDPETSVLAYVFSFFDFFFNLFSLLFLWWRPTENEKDNEEKLEKASHTRKNPQQNKKAKMCDPCLREHTQTEATKFCKTCLHPEPLCDACAQLHTRQKATKDHVMCDGLEQFPDVEHETKFHRMSESVFVKLCKIFGTSTQVAIRRETTDFSEMVMRRVIDDDVGLIEIISGSTREGFRLKESDKDWMYWQSDQTVIWDMAQSEYYNTAIKVLILSDTSESPPGFSLLELLTPTRDSYVQSACVPMNDKLYISSSLYKRQFHSTVFSNSTVHGPCQSGVLFDKEYDLAFCFACDFWPPSASSWIDRCHSWPDKEVVADIVRNGCHFVPIGNPLEAHGHELEEWRISFSLAEHKLVYSMDHCQFLIYGLLKLFLKEVINRDLKEHNKLLCSYHIKTSLFWVIQQNVIPFWCPQNVLGGFWVCFKLLIKMVYEGVCPNFFIPQNNMFLSKVHGSAQRSLFIKLYDMYEKGLTVCLLNIPSIHSCITDVQYNPRFSICTDESKLRSEVDFDIELLSEISSRREFKMDTSLYTQLLHTLEQLIGSPMTQYQVASLQTMTATNLQNIAFTIHNMYANTGRNKQMYIADKISCNMVKLAAKFGFISDMVYIAMYFYKTSRYGKALSVVEKIKGALAQPYLMYKGVDARRYTEYLGGQSFSTKMRQAVAEDIILNTSVCFINELTLEQQIARLNNWAILYIPLFEMLHFVEFLCYRQIDRSLAQVALDKLQDLVHHHRVCQHYGDISWQILGICHQITGNHRAALYSYIQSFNQNSVNKIQFATLCRIALCNVQCN